MKVGQYIDISIIVVNYSYLNIDIMSGIRLNLDVLRSKINFSSISSMSTMSELIFSCARRILRCSILTMSRCREFSNLSSKAMNSGI